MDGDPSWLPLSFTIRPRRLLKHIAGTQAAHGNLQQLQVRIERRLLGHGGGHFHAVGGRSLGGCSVRMMRHQGLEFCDLSRGCKRERKDTELTCACFGLHPHADERVPLTRAVVVVLVSGFVALNDEASLA